MFLLFTAALLAAPPAARAVSGERVSLAEGTLIVAWRLDDASSLAALRLAEQTAEELDLPLLALNLDGADAASRLTPWLRARGFTMSALADADGTWRRQLQVTEPVLLVIGADERVQARVAPEAVRTPTALAAHLGLPEGAVSTRPDPDRP